MGAKEDTSGEASADICIVCHRDPEKPPPAPSKFRGSQEKWAEKWARRVRVVAHGRCAKDYQAMRRPKSRRNAKKGVSERATIWMTPQLKASAQRVAAQQGKSFSDYCAHAIEADVERTEKTTQNSSPSAA